jgi:peptide/nickel transport system permease protein
MSSSGGTSRLSGLKRIVRLYLKSRIGMIGLIIIVFFLTLAGLASVIAPNNPVTGIVAAPFDVPTWSTLLPWYTSVPVDARPLNTTFNSVASVDAWTWSPGASESVTSVTPPYQKAYTGSLLVNASVTGRALRNASDPNLPGGVVFFTLTKTFKFTGSPPAAYTAYLLFEPLEMKNVSHIYVRLVIYDPKGDNFSMAALQPSSLYSDVVFYPYQAGQWVQISIPDDILPITPIQAYANTLNPCPLVFNGSGTYRFSVQVLAVPTSHAAQSAISVRIANAALYMQGGAYGPLGTDNQGRDVWAQFVWGSQVSLLIGIFSGIGAVALGAIIGVGGGYLGGVPDEAIGRFTDFFLVLPFLPLLLILVTLLAANAALYANIYWWVILIFVVLSWPGIAKIIRAQVLSIKERQYVEASRALGSETGHILRKHIIPNVMGLVYSQVALNVAGFILLEAALDFLAISIHSVTTMTWGLMLTYSLPFAVNNPNLSYVWWWFLPPGIAIALLSVAFVLVGFALDSIFNPRLRAR